MAEYQLRVYDVKPGKMEEFVRVFEPIPEIRRRHGFTVEGVWVDDESNRFAWVVGYDGPGTFAEAAARFDSDPERKDMSPPPGSFLDHVDIRMVRRIG